MADVIIRQAGPADTADIFEIEKLCFPDPWSMDSIRYELEENETALAKLQRGFIIETV